MHASNRSTVRSHAAHAAAYVPVHVSRGLTHLVRPHHVHTAARLRKARRHGTEALQIAARKAQVDAANSQHLAEPTQQALAIPQQPLHVMNLPPLRGSREILIRQNQRADEEGLARVRDEQDIAALLRNGLLVSLPDSGGLRSDPRLPDNRRYCRPWTAKFLADLGRAHSERFGDDLQVNSAVRTVEYQKHLLHINGNAAPADGDTASPHLTGAAIDIGKKAMPAAELAWMRSYLAPLIAAGKIDVEEEFYQSCFHISVYQSYQGTAPTNAASLRSRIELPNKAPAAAIR